MTTLSPPPPAKRFSCFENTVIISVYKGIYCLLNGVKRLMQVKKPPIAQFLYISSLSADAVDVSRFLDHLNVESIVLQEQRPPRDPVRLRIPCLLSCRNDSLVFFCLHQTLSWNLTRFL